MIQLKTKFKTIKIIYKLKEDQKVNLAEEFRKLVLIQKNKTQHL